MAFFFTRNKNIFIQAEVNILHPVMRALTNSFGQFKPIADQTFTGELGEETRVLYCQKSIFIIVKNDYSKAVESNLLSCVQIGREFEEFTQGSQESAPIEKETLQSVSHTACLVIKLQIETEKALLKIF